jgi:hypothetical protein
MKIYFWPPSLAEIFLKIDKAEAVIEAKSLTVDGRSIVVLSLAIFEKALTYCSAMLRETALDPPSRLMLAAIYRRVETVVFLCKDILYIIITRSMEAAVAFAFARTAAASPSAAKTKTFSTTHTFSRKKKVTFIYRFLFHCF